MINIIGLILVVVAIICDYYIIKSTIQSYKHMKDAKRKAMIWNARIK